MNVCNVYVCAYKLQVQAICKGMCMGGAVLCMCVFREKWTCVLGSRVHPMIPVCPTFTSNARHELLQIGTFREASSSLMLTSRGHIT